MRTLIPTPALLTALFLASAPFAAAQGDGGGSPSTPAPSFGQPASVVLADKVNLDLVWIKPGDFMMGDANASEKSNEGPQTHVTLTKGFWLGKFEVTQAQWQAIMGTTVEQLRQENLARAQAVNVYYPDHGSGPDLPMYYLQWEDAMAFCKKLTDIERAAGRLPAGYEYTLPSSAQWEYACRAGTTTRFYNGDADSDLDKIAWYGEAPPKAKNEPNTSPMHPVGQKAPNAWGLYDMFGNVQEWCYDILHSSGRYPGGAITDYVDYADRPFKGYVMRGGNIIEPVGSFRAATQSWGGYTFSQGTTGFRVALTQVPRPPSVVTAEYIRPLRPVEVMPMATETSTIKDPQAAAKEVLLAVQHSRGLPALANSATHAALLTDLNVLESLANAILGDEGKDSTAMTKLPGELTAALNDTVYRAELIHADAQENNDACTQAQNLEVSLQGVLKK